MAKARKVKQLSFGIADRPGLLSGITDAIARAKVNITAICAYAMDNKAYFMMTTESNAKAKKALAELKIKPEEEDVVTVEMPNTTGSLQKVAKKIADAGINIFYLYATASTGKTSTCVFSTSDDRKAIKAINR
jgi:hypothetical protein